MAEENRGTVSADAPVSAAQTDSGLDLGSLLGGLLSGGAGEKSGGGTNALGDGIGAVLRDPEMMAKLPAMIEMLRPMMGNLTGAEKAESADAAAKPTEKAEHREEAALPASKSSGGKGKSCHERRIALLCAIRPYLNPRRKEAIDYILRMYQMGKLFRQS